MRGIMNTGVAIAIATIAERRKEGREEENNKT
jgi:hypothetical protein